MGGVCACETTTPQSDLIVEKEKHEKPTPLVLNAIPETEPAEVKAEAEITNRCRAPTGLFTVELVFTKADGSMFIFNIEYNDLGLEFDTKMPLTVSKVKPQSVSESIGVKCGMILATVGGQEITKNCQTVNAASVMLNEAISGLPPTPLTADSMEEQPPLSPQRKKSTAELLLLSQDICLTGPWSKWATDFPNATLEPVPADAKKGTALLRLCVKLTSQSFSFQVITDELKWKWHLFPRDAVPIRIGFICSHVSKEGLLKAGEEDLAAVGLGNDKLGHGINFHVMEKVGTVVTIWVEVPSNRSDDGECLKLRTDTVEGSRIWYTLEDTGVQLNAGDGINLSRYKSYLPADLKLG